jgi:hypothetical protein
VTVDVPVAGARLRDTRNGMTIPPTLTPRTVANAIPRPAWWINFLTTEPLAFASLDRWSGTVAELLDTMFDPTVDYADLAWITIENYGLWHLVPKECRSEMLKALPHYAFRVLGRWITRTGNKPRDGVYSIDSFNEYGDVVFPRPESVQGPIQQSAHPSAVGEPADLINEYAAWCAERGAVCVVAGYPILRGQVIPPPPPAYDQFDAELREKLDCEVISVSRDYFMDQSYFYDTYYHLTDEGVAIRTEQLIEDLRNWEGAEQYLSPAP